MVSIDRDLLFTPSIYDAYEWFQSCPPSWKERAYISLFNSLSRVPWTPDAKVQRGLDFEDLVYRAVRAPDAEVLNASSEFMDVVSEVRGAWIQKTVKKIERVGDQSFCLYGRTDAWFPDIIKDVKTTASFKKAKYANSIQHQLYCHIEQIPKFRYVVAVFDDNEDNKKVQRVEKIDIEYADLEPLKTAVYERVQEFWNFINDDADLLKAYLTKFCKY